MGKLSRFFYLLNKGDELDKRIQDIKYEVEKVIQNVNAYEKTTIDCYTRMQGDIYKMKMKGLCKTCKHPADMHKAKNEYGWVTLKCPCKDGVFK